MSFSNESMDGRCFSASSLCSSQYLITQSRLLWHSLELTGGGWRWIIIFFLVFRILMACNRYNVCISRSSSLVCSVASSATKSAALNGWSIGNCAVRFIMSSVMFSLCSELEMALRGCEVMPVWCQQFVTVSFFMLEPGDAHAAGGRKV